MLKHCKDDSDHYMEAKHQFAGLNTQQIEVHVNALNNKIRMKEEAKQWRIIYCFCILQMFSAKVHFQLIVLEILSSTVPYQKNNVFLCTTHVLKLIFKDKITFKNMGPSLLLGDLKDLFVKNTSSFCSEHLLKSSVVCWLVRPVKGEVLLSGKRLRST